MLLRYIPSSSQPGSRMPTHCMALILSLHVSSTQRINLSACAHEDKYFDNHYPTLNNIKSKHQGPQHTNCGYPLHGRSNGKRIAIDLPRLVVATPHRRLRHRVQEPARGLRVRRGSNRVSLSTED